jgi:hypothetical protein
MRLRACCVSVIALACGLLLNCQTSTADADQLNADYHHRVERHAAIHVHPDRVRIAERATLQPARKVSLAPREPRRAALPDSARYAPAGPGRWAPPEIVPFIAPPPSAYAPRAFVPATYVTPALARYVAPASAPDSGPAPGRHLEPAPARYLEPITPGHYLESTPARYLEPTSAHYLEPTTPARNFEPTTPVRYLEPAAARFQPRTFSDGPETTSPLRPVAYSPGYLSAIPTSFRPDIEQPMRVTGLSPAATWVSQIAARNGDRTFILVDKARGKLFLFANGAPIFTSAALTGSSLADRLPYDALSKTFAEASDLRYRVTPAGRFTVSPGHDRTYGNTLDINEIKGRNWIIAIHLVPSQSREARLASTSDQDKHATEGCVNVDANTIRVLTRLLEMRRSTPLYIVPNDERMVSQFF